MKALKAIALVAAMSAFAAGAAVPKPAFSFKYGEKAIAGSESMQVDEHLKVTVESKEYPQFDAVEWVLWFENPSSEKSAVLSEMRDGDFLVPLPPAPPRFVGDISLPGDRAVVTMNGCVPGLDYSISDLRSAGEFAANVRYFHPRCRKEHEVHNLGARPSEGEAPFFEVTQGGQGAVIALGWTGGWNAKFKDGADGVRVEAGLAHARFYLEPGEKLRTSRVLVMNYAKGEDSGNKFRRLLRRHFSHVASHPGAREGLLAYELWGGLTSDEMIRRVKTLKAKGLAYEDLWIDAGWYGRATKCDDAYTGDWWPWAGDWTPNPRIHPKGLEDVRDAAKDAGMGIMLWFEPERVGKPTDFAKEHPDLLVGPLLNYGDERARNFVRDMLVDFAGRLNFSCYRQDFNIEPSGIFRENDAKDREGVTEIRHVTGMYQIWDELLERCPKLLIDNCSGGGRRIDIETLRRSIPFFRSDYQCGFNANADVLQVHNVGLSRLLPYNGCTIKLSDEYSLRSAYSSSHGVAYWNAIFQDEKKVDWAAAKKCCDEYRRIRKYFPCDFYNHGSAALDDTAWAIWQYDDPESGEGVVMAFRRAASPSDKVKVPLKGLPAGAKVEVENLDTGAKTLIRGELEIVLPSRRSSTVLLYRVQSGGSPIDECARIFDAEIKDGVIHGATVLAGDCEGNEIAASWGWADAAHTVPMTPTTVVDMASVTKAAAGVTAYLVAHAQGKVDFDAPFTNYLSAYSAPLPRRVTVRDLANHVSGFGEADGASPRVYFDADVVAMMRKIMSLPPAEPTHGKVVYSCRNYILLGQALESALGCRLDEFCRREIFLPAGMKDTSLGAPLPTVELGRLAQTMGTDRPGVISDYVARPLWAEGVGTFNAGLFSTAEDMARLMRVYLRGGVCDDGTRLFGVREMEQIAPTSTNSVDGARSFGWQFAAAELPALLEGSSLFHSGWSGQTVLFDLARRRYAVVLTTRCGDYARAKKERFAAIAALMGGV